MKFNGLVTERIGEPTDILSRALEAPAFVPYPTSEVQSSISQWLEQIQVVDVNARYFTCSRCYRMVPRRLGDDIFFYVARGRARITIGEVQTWLEAGDCAHISQGVWHAALTDPNYELHVIVLHYNALVLDSLRFTDFVRLPSHFHWGTSHPIVQLLHEACREHCLRPWGWQQGLRATVLSILLRIGRENPEILESVAHTGAIAHLQRLRPALEAMRQNLAEPLSMKQLAAACSLSDAQFRRVFQQGLGSSPVQYLRRRRIEAACTLLRDTHLSIEKIAEKVGYAETSFFARTFRAAMGVTPGQYRSNVLCLPGQDGT